MSEMSMAEKIKSLRTSLDLTLEDVANEVGVGKSTVRKWETGMIANMRRDKIASLAKALHTTPAYLMGWETSPKEPSTTHDLPSDIVPYAPTHRIPILGRISAGLPLYAEEHIEGYTYTELNGGAEYFALRVSGDSMNTARINDGDILIVRRQEVVDNGQIAVVIVNGDEATVKRFYQNGSQITLMPQSSNAIHQPQIYDATVTEVRIVGLVVKNEITF